MGATALTTALGPTLGAALPGVLTGSLGLAAGNAMAADPFPSRTITLWVPWSPGGATDLTFRLLAEGASKRLGQKVVIDNRGGAAGTLAMPILQTAAPDGYTLAQLPQTVLRAPWTRKVLWDPVRDTTPILQLSGVTFGVVVPADSPFKSLDDLFAYAKAHPGELTVATNGGGSTPHVVMDELFGRQKLSFTHIPYKGTAEQMLAVASGQVQAGVNSNGFAPFVDSGQLRLLVTFGEDRSARWPNAPTLKELGHGIVAQSPYGIAGPAGMPPDVVEKLHQAFKAALFDPAFVAELAKYDQQPTYLGPADYAAAIRKAYAHEGEAMKRLGLRKH
jgi:tripartite-type tricarboxylate transporter receptor subunit TctC